MNNHAKNGNVFLWTLEKKKRKYVRFFFRYGILTQRR